MPFSVDQVLRRAQIHIKAGEIAEAVELYKQVLSRFPKNKKATQGYNKLKSGVVSKESSFPEPSQEQVQELLNLYNQGEFEEVLSEIEPLVGLFPQSITLHNINGASNAALERLDVAIESYKLALKINPRYAEAYNNMGIALNNKGDPNAAINSYDKALNIKPDYAEAYNNKGIALKDKGDLDAAIDSYGQALKIKPDYAGAYDNIRILLDKGDVNTQKIFQTIYKAGLWGKGSDLYFSGNGSHDEKVVSTYTTAIGKWCAGFDGKLDAVDLGCGDFAVGSKIRHLFDGYIGCDVVPEVIFYNSNKFQSPGLQFLCLDISKDNLPKGDVVFIRQVFQHLSNKLILATLPKLVERYSHIILTEHLPKGGNFTANLDKQTGIYARGGLGSGIVLTEPPFDLDVLNEIVLCDVPAEDGIIRTTAYQLK